MITQDYEINSVIEAAHGYGHELSKECAKAIIDALDACLEHESYSCDAGGVIAIEEKLRREMEEKRFYKKQE